VRILADGIALERDHPRMRPAVLGLAARGHEVWWRGPRPGEAPEDLRPAPPGLALGRVHADVMVGSGERPLGIALAGWVARAHAAVLDLRLERVRRWSGPERLAWHSLYAIGLLEPDEAAAAAADPPLERERLGLWSDGAAAAGPDTAHVDTEILERACERALARARSRAPRPAVFLDRDGTLVVERGYLSEPDQLQLLPGVPTALRNLRAAGHALVVISNQAGVGRGRFPASAVYATMARLRRELRALGAEPDAIYVCPHAPEDNCACRKPGTAMLERAADDLILSLADSTMVGDKRIDAAAGQRAGGRGVLVRTGYGAEEAKRGAEGVRPPDQVVEDLEEAARWILSHPVGSARG
jgi:histidinol-phosphate phosphatase family protein